VSSKADDFDVRYRESGQTRDGLAAATGGYAGTVDYDLGYDANGWDTNGFRSPEAGYVASNAGTAGQASAFATRSAGSHEALTGPQASGGASTQEFTPLQWDDGPDLPAGHPSAPRPSVPRRPDARSGRADARRGHRASGSGGPAGPGGPRGPQGPDGLRGPGRRRGLDRPPVKVKGSWWRHWTLRKAIGLLLSIIGAFVVLGAVVVFVAYERTPVPSEALAATSFTQSKVVSSDGTLIGRFGTTNRQMLTYTQLQQNKYVIDAVLAAEDRNFFNEGGISPTGITRAAYEDIRGNDGSLQGGSTITQEFVRQYYSGIGTQQTLSRKIKEIFVAMKVAKEKSKPWILTNYLNTIYLGQGSYGIAAAAETYFGKPVTTLDAAQAALLAAVIQQPSTYPLPQYRAQLEARWHYVLTGMVQMGTLTPQQAATMKFPSFGDNVPQTVGSDVWDPYVLAMVYNELTEVDHLTQSQIYGGGYTIRTTIDDTKMKALYSAVIQNEAQIDESGFPFVPTYMHAGAVLEDPSNGAIQALYPGPGYPGAKYNGIGKVISKSYCKKIACEVNMAVYNREQVGSSFKPYILSAAVKQGMNVQTSTLDGYNNVYIPPDSAPTAYPSATDQPDYYLVHNDDLGENGPYTPQIAMAVSINTAYTDLWHVVAGQDGTNVVNMAKAFGVNTDLAGITAGSNPSRNYAGIALGQASLTVGEQATMLATIDNGGTYHDMHVVSSVTQPNAPAVPLMATSYPVFSENPTLNADEASQVQYAMSKDTASYGTAPVAAMSNGQEVIAKTGTTNTAQSAFFVGAIPSQALAVALFTNQQGQGKETLDNLGGAGANAGDGGTWPATIWHDYSENMFVRLGVEQFTAPTFTGTTWNLVPPGLRKVAKKPAKKKTTGPGTGNGNFPGTGGGTGGGNPNPNPIPTYSCDPSVVTCGTAGGTGQSVNATEAGAAVGGGFTTMPAIGLWVRRRMRKRGRGRG
jgi:membrane peptidoglycan carboxypeptidase